MAYNGYIIKINLSKSNNKTQPGNIDYEGRLYVPKSYSTKEYIQSEWNLNSSAEDKVIALATMGISGFGCPFYSPGGFDTLSGLPNYQMVFPLISNCEEISGTVVNQWVALTTPDSVDGIYIYKQGERGFRYNNQWISWGSAGSSVPFGLTNLYNYGRANAKIFFLTSDNFLGEVFIDVMNKSLSFHTSEESAKFIEWLESVENIAESDPYSNGYGGYSGNGGGGGNHDYTNDAVPIPSLPVLSASNAGFCTAYNPSISQMQALANYMWTDTLFDLDNLKKLFADPMDVFMSLLIVPVAVDNGGNREFLVGNWSTGLYMNIVASQYQSVDCGSVTINEFWGAYLDYAPYTKVELFLPFIGMVSLATDDVMGKTISIRYNIDLLTGACTAFVYDGLRVLYSFPGNCATAIPFSGNSYTEMIKSLISIGTTAAVAGWSAGLAASGEGISTGSVNKFANAATAEGLKESVKGAVNDFTGSQSLLKPTIQRTGSMGSSAGLLGVRTPYLIITRENLCLPNHQNQFIGYPSYTEVLIGSLEGFTIIESVHLEGIPCTEEEIHEIELMLAGGVIF